MSHGCQRPALLQVYRGKAKYSIHHESWVFLIARLDLVAKVLISSYVTFTWIFVQNEAVAVGISTLDHSMACLTQDPGLPGSFLWGPWATSDRKSIHHPSSNLWSCFIWKVHETLTKNSWVPTTNYQVQFWEVSTPNRRCLCLSGQSLCLNALSIIFLWLHLRDGPEGCCDP